MLLRNIWRPCSSLELDGIAVGGSNSGPRKYVNREREVFLLDGADFFLEDRSLKDLERNSLVSGRTFHKLMDSGVN
jgi:hypothetical protein